MSLLKSVWTDLVERRLWPVAAGLLVALVAIPVALGRGGSAPADDVATAAPAHGIPATQVVSLATSKPKGAPLGAPHSPFRRMTDAATAGSSPVGAPVVSPASSGGSTSPSGDAGGSSVPDPAPVTKPVGGPAPDTTPDTPSTPSAPATPRVAEIDGGYRVDVTFGPADSAKARTDLTRLNPLSTLEAPLALYMGVKDDRSTAIFALLSDVTATGDGTCRPSADDCQVVGLKVGDAELLEVTMSDGSVAGYQLQVDKVAQKTLDTAAAGRASRHRESETGRGLLRSAIAASPNTYVGNYRYSVGPAVLVKTGS